MAHLVTSTKTTQKEWSTELRALNEEESRLEKLIQGFSSSRVRLKHGSRSWVEAGEVILNTMAELQAVWDKQDAHYQHQFARLEALAKVLKDARCDRTPQTI